MCSYLTPTRKLVFDNIEVTYHQICRFGHYCYLHVGIERVAKGNGVDPDIDIVLLLCNYIRPNYLGTNRLDITYNLTKLYVSMWYSAFSTYMQAAQVQFKIQIIIIYQHVCIIFLAHYICTYLSYLYIMYMLNYAELHNVCWYCF